MLECWMCHAEAHLKHLAGSQTNLLRKMSAMWENLLASPQICPTLQKCCEIPSSKINVFPLDHKGLLVMSSPTSLPTTSSKVRISCAVDITGLKVIAFSIWELWNEITVPCTGLFVLLCKCCSSALEEFSWKIVFLFRAVLLCNSSLGKLWLSFHRSQAPGCPLPHCWRKAEKGPFFLQSEISTNLVGQYLGKGHSLAIYTGYFPCDSAKCGKGLKLHLDFWIFFLSWLCFLGCQYTTNLQVRICPVLWLPRLL